jgi:glycosyltransferase involved in cell wall biosynthesis
MPQPAILFDRHDLVARMGTGVATYARNLAIAARQAGWSVNALASAETRLSTKEPVLSEILLYDTGRAKQSAALRTAQVAIAGAISAPFGFRPRQLPHTGVVTEPNADAAALYDETFVDRRLFDTAAAYFRCYGRPATVRMEETPALFHASHPLPLRVKGCPNIVTIHDLVPLHLPYMTLDNKRFFYHLVSHLVREADHIVTVSEYSRDDIMKVFGVPGDRITNTYQAVSFPRALTEKPIAAAGQEVEDLFDLEPGGYFLFLGAIEPKKNVTRLINAYLMSGSRRPLVIAGGLGWQYDDDLARINDERFMRYRVTPEFIAAEKRVRHVSYVKFAHLVSLIRCARALLFPSLFEGFGLPVLEAMTLGTPVMTSNVTSLPEVAGDAALFADPTDVSAMAAAIRKLDADDDLCAELAQRGPTQAAKFSAERYRERIATLYGRLLGSPDG